MSLGENIKSAFEVVLKTYENVDKLLRYCDLIAEDYGYEVVTDKFLRYKSDSNYEGWFINSFIKLYQSKHDNTLENSWKDGPVFVMEINFEDMPTVYLSKFEYEDISSWGKGVSPSEYWGFTDPIDCEGNGFNESPIDEKEGYYISEPTPDLKSRYWDVKRVIYTKTDLLQIDSSNVSKNIFGEFDTLNKF
ncbi:hypothetical protein BD780_003504 [Clostridium tetanomorphum]|uniref:hypothetical protein n=1 Tax=Clostridium tetanomorphum TaxID=1553 RepID=UPI00044C3DE7|nr:hypothetical protein [Clostridium tetanomorphum]KAJ49369.1 hypothetical protein CTM_23414 [Clostridium tetanomorphum DSM 665]KAJ51208.1 hypothetical protein CTM_13848 [Clostridium tetanomorphum DSM 665]MBP1863703.1 hypothetical protein [Clostridium tetanomorphum]NRS86279.1 hypothetical protein [Clostridium tetanomorphum]SQC00713.1 Uncharacterised protein [Clostridium tetanomorphum]